MISSIRPPSDESATSAFARALVYAAIAILVVSALLLVRAHCLDAATRQERSRALVADLARSLDSNLRTDHEAISAIGDQYELAIREGYGAEFRESMLGHAHGRLARLWIAHCDARVKKLGDAAERCR